MERRLGRLTGRPLSLTPMSVQRDDYATGLMRLVSVALRVLTLLECVGRRQLAAEASQLAGLSAGNAKRETARPTAERLLEAFRDITLTILEEPQQTYRYLTLEPTPTARFGGFGLLLRGVGGALPRFCRTALKMGEP